MKIFIFDLDDTIIYYPNNIVNYDNIKSDLNLYYLLDNLNSTKIIYTNGTYGHAEEVLKKMKLNNLFNKIYARDTIPLMKPHINSFKYVEKDIKNHINKNNEYYFFDDRLDNLMTAKSLGWVTIFINLNFIDKPLYVDHSFSNIHSAVMYFLV